MPLQRAEGAMTGLGTLLVTKMFIKRAKQTVLEGSKQMLPNKQPNTTIMGYVNGWNRDGSWEWIKALYLEETNRRLEWDNSS